MAKKPVAGSGANLINQQPLATKASLVVLASGQGSLAAALIEAATCDDYPAQVVALISDRPQAGALKIADDAGVQSLVVSQAQGQPREQWCAELADSVQRFTPRLVVCAGFMRILTPDFLATFPSRVINTHPSLLPQFPGASAVADALAAGVAKTGASIHFVDEGVDTGPVIAQVEVPVLPGDDVKTLHERIKQAERRQLVDVVAELVGQ